MLQWWLGGGKSNDGRDQDDPYGEAPETPAPLFAARALKTALFGTPAPPEDSDSEFEKKSTTVNKHESSSQSRNLSSTKPSGILMTPGTSTSRRKTVSFGNDVLENNKKIRKADLLNGISNESSSTFRNNLASKSPFSNQLVCRTPLTQTIEKVRELKTTDEAGNKSNPIKSKSSLNSDFKVGSEVLPEPKSQTFQFKKEQKCSLGHRESIVDDLSEEETTVDLNQPRSQSGKYWKSEFENYVQDARPEMKKLLAFKELAKSYALMKEAQAITMAEKLKEEERKVLAMEEIVSQLTKNFTSAEDVSNKIESPASALGIQRLMGMENNASIADVKRETVRLKKQLEEMTSLKMENSKLLNLLIEKDAIITKLNTENTRITQKMFHQNSRFATSGRDQIPHEELRERRDEAFHKFQVDSQDIKNRAILRIADTEHPIDTCYDQSDNQSKGVNSVESPEATIKELGMSKATKHRSAADCHKKRTLIPPYAQRLEVQDSSIPILRHSSSQASPSGTASHLTLPQSYPTVLTEVINKANVDSVPSPHSGPIRHSPLLNRNSINGTSNTALESHFYGTFSDIPALNHTPTKSKLNSFKATNDRNLKPSPRPSIIRIEDTPLKRASLKNYSMNSGRVNNSSSKLEHVERRATRVTLPPERIEAAKKRLAEKKRLAAGSSRVKQSI